MHLMFNILGRQIPGYGLMITTGLIVANLIAYLICKKYKLNYNDFIITEAYIGLFAFAGTKLLYLIVSYNLIDWSRFFSDLRYFQDVMQGGFVFYGGLIGGLLSLLFTEKVHHIDYRPYLQHIIFLIPFAHAFGRVGCHFAGCCYGIPYDGPLSVTFPDNSYALPGVPLFPVQLTEACLLLILSLIVFIVDTKKITTHTVCVYVIGYSIIRFSLEYLRYDAVRGHFFLFSTSQWISIFMLIGTIGYLLMTKKAPSVGKNKHS